MRNRPSVAARAALAAVCLIIGLSAPSVHAGTATQVVVLLPGQSLGPGGISGTPTPQEPREPFVVRVVAVDATLTRDFSYSGPLFGLHTSEAVPTAALRLATSISGAGAATTIPQGGGHLRMSLNGEDYRDYDLQPASNGDEVCASIVAALTEGNAGREVALGCDFDASSSRYTLWMADRRPLRENLRGTYFENSLTVDPGFGLAPALHLGVAEPPSADPDDASEFIARRLVADPMIDLVFDRGVALFSVGWNTLADLGPNKMLVLDQGPGGLPVASSPFEVEPSVFKITAATALGDGNGRINRVRLAFNHDLDPQSVGGQASQFTLEDTGTSNALVGTSLTLSDYDVQGYSADAIEVAFGTGLGKTDITNVEVHYTAPASGILSSDMGAALGSVTIGEPRLVDGAPPVIVAVTFQDVDGNGGLDLMQLVFSEDVAFSAGRGVSVSGFEPTPDTALSAVPLPASLTLAIDGTVQTLELHHPTDPGASEIPAGSAVADAITIAVRTAPLNRPALANFTCEFLNGRYVLRAGIPVRPLAVLTSPALDDVSSLLKLGLANGGIERLGSADAIGDLDDFIVLSQDGESLRTSLLEGQGPGACVINGSALEIDLTNVPGSGTSTPAYLWKDNRDSAFIRDRALVPNLARPSNSVGLPDEFHPTELIRIRDDDAAPDDGTITKSPGPVSLDATQTIPPLLPANVSSDARFRWTQVSGPYAAIQNSETDDAETTLLEAGTYEFALTMTVLEGEAPPAFNPYVHGGDGTLAKSVPVHITPGPTTNVVLLLPGQTLRPGVLTQVEAIEGAGGIATPGVPYLVRLVCSDTYFNTAACPPGASALLTTTDPSDVPPPPRPLIGTGVSFFLTPATPGTFLVDDQLVGFSETGDVPHAYVIGSVWNANADRVPGVPGSIRLTWSPDPRPVTWNVYIGTLPIADLDGSGSPDLGYGSCATSQDPDPADTTFDDFSIPPPGSGLFYVGTMVLDGQETSPGVSSSGLPRIVAQPCP